MIGNISKSKAQKGDPLKFSMLSDLEKESLRGERGYTPLVVFEYDEETGELSYSSNGTMYPQDYISTHDLATKGYVGKLSELRTIDKTSIVAAINELYEKAVAKKAFVVVKGGADNWTAAHETDDGGNIIRPRYAQVVNVNNAVVTFNSKVDLQVTDEQFAIFYEKDIGFSTTNENGVVTVYCVGNVPENDYEFQVVVTEVE